MFDGEYGSDNLGADEKDSQVVKMKQFGKMFGDEGDSLQRAAAEMRGKARIYDSEASM